ncbi:MAG TPA: hypothetical protein VNZ57_09235 [Longimicrobiales bacterium]|nr:hypothetical protein [Longimicrobiales bacterium]
MSDGVRLTVIRDSRVWRVRSAYALLAAIVLACGPGNDGGRGDGNNAEPSRPVRYERRFWFVSAAPGEAPVSAAFDFEVVDDGVGLRRFSSAWLGRGEAWRPLLDTVVVMAPIREPWRIMPHASLRLIVGDSGAVDALVYGTGPDEVRLLPGRSTESWVAPDAELVFAPADMRIAGLTYRGALLDTRMGYRPGRPAPFADSERARQLFLTDGEGSVLTLLAAGSQDEALMWVRHADGTSMFQEAKLERLVPDEAVDGAPPLEWVVRRGSDGEILARAGALAVHEAGDRRHPRGPALHYPVAGTLFTGVVPREVVGFVREGSR